MDYEVAFLHCPVIRRNHNVKTYACAAAHQFPEPLQGHKAGNKLTVPQEIARVSSRCVQENMETTLRSEQAVARQPPPVTATCIQQMLL